LAIYDGVVTVADDDIPVILELEDDSIRLSASGREIGEWPVGECRINHVGDTTYTITAEDETLEFIPNQPSLFAAAVNGGPRTVSLTPEKEPDAQPEDGVRRAPPPKPLTMGLFYALCVATAALALWSLIAIIV
jgi:hypothetical protein